MIPAWSSTAKTLHLVLGEVAAELGALVLAAAASLALERLEPLLPLGEVRVDVFRGIDDHVWGIGIGGKPVLAVDDLDAVCDVDVEDHVEHPSPEGDDGVDEGHGIVQKEDLVADRSVDQDVLAGRMRVAMSRTTELVVGSVGRVKVMSCCLGVGPTTAGSWCWSTGGCRRRECVRRCGVRPGRGR